MMRRSKRDRNEKQANFQQFPPRIRAAGFSIDQVMTKMEQALSDS